jgi:hypothetical protein
MDFSLDRLLSAIAENPAHCHVNETNLLIEYVTRSVEDAKHVKMVENRVIRQPQSQCKAAAWRLKGINDA